MFQFIILAGDNIFPMLHEEIERNFAFLRVTFLGLGRNPVIQPDLAILVAVIADRLPIKVSYTLRRTAEFASDAICYFCK